jgi:hypothetical protein
MSNGFMGLFKLKRTVVAEPRFDGGARVPVAENFDDLPPVYVDRERIDKALSGERTIIPNGLSAEDICRFMDHVAKDVR